MAEVEGVVEADDGDGYEVAAGSGAAKTEGVADPGFLGL